MSETESLDRRLAEMTTAAMAGDEQQLTRLIDLLPGSMLRPAVRMLVQLQAQQLSAGLTSGQRQGPAENADRTMDDHQWSGEGPDERGGAG